MEIIDSYCDRESISLEELADKAGIDRRQVFKIRHGRPVRRYARSAVAGVLGVLPQDLKPKQVP
jgi:transcriptional regulator with XRE-family HTH domain